MTSIRIIPAWDGENVQQKLDASIGHLPEDVQHKLLWGNAAKLYGIEGPGAESSRA